MVKLKSNEQVNFELELGVELYTKVVGLKKLHVSCFWALAKFCPELQLSNGQAEPDSEVLQLIKINFLYKLEVVRNQKL